MYNLTVSFHKGNCSSAHIGHNNRTIKVPHSDPKRKELNVIYKAIPIKEAYHFLFNEALKEYNKSKKPCRRIANYFEHVTKLYERGEEKLNIARANGASKKELAKIKSTYSKPFNEIIVSIGNSDDYKGEFKNGGGKDELSVDILNDYIKSFEKRNPNLFVFNAVLHRDEIGVPHLHIDYIPWSDEPGRGLTKRLTENGAFKQQGLTSGTKGDNGSIAFQNRERTFLKELSKKNDINIIDGQHSNKHLQKSEYLVDHNKKILEQQAHELITYQDELENFIRNYRHKNLYKEHIEYFDLKNIEKKYIENQKFQKNLLDEYWKDFNDSTKKYFEFYRKKKHLIYNEINLLKEGKSNNYKIIQSLLLDIQNKNEWILTKLLKVIILLFAISKSNHLKKELDVLYKINNNIKEESKVILDLSNKNFQELKTNSFSNLNKALNDYEKELLLSQKKIQFFLTNKYELDK